MLQDLRYALRFLARRRGFTLVAVLTLALGVGVNAAIFSVADAVLFRPLPYAHRDRLVVLEPVKVATGARYSTLPVADLEAVRAAGVFDAVIDLDYVSSVFIRQGDRLQPLRVQPVPLEYLETLGVAPLIGRDFRRDDGENSAVLLTHRTWTARYGADPAVVGTSIRIVSGQSLRVVGVLPRSFRTATATAFFNTPDMLMLRSPFYPTGTRASTPVARLAPGVTRAAAAARTAVLHGVELKPGDVQLRVVPLRDVMGRASSRTLTLLCAIAVLVLLVGCANLVNLVLARGAERRRELAVRASLGASRWRIVRLLVVENLIVAAVGGAAGIAIAFWSFRALQASLPAALARTTAPVFDARVFAFAAAAAAAAGILSSLLPAWRLARADMKTSLEAGRLHTHPLRTGPKAMLSIELGLALVSVVSALILAQSLWMLVTNELGFDARRLIVSARTVGGAATGRDATARFAEFSRELDAIRTIPAVRSAAATTSLPATGAAADFALFPNRQERGGVWMISAGFFRTMGVRMIAGRELEERESFSGAPVGVLNQSAVRVLFPDGRAIGREVRAPRQPPRTIVGIVADSRQSLKRAAEPAMYVPFDRKQFRMAQAIVDTDDTPAVREQIRQAIVRVSPDSDIRVESISTLLDSDVAVLRFTMAVIGAFALLTVALAMLGVYGVITFISGERLREYGVRVALGAPRAAIGALVLRQAMVPAAIGLSAGSVAASWTARVLAAEILDVVPANATTFAAAAAGLFVCAALAASVPARRATRVDPIVVLRME